MRYRKRLLFITFFFGLTIHAQAALVRYAVIPESPRPGEPVTIGVSADAGARTAALVLNGKRLTRVTFFPIPVDGEEGSLLAAVLTVPATVKPGEAIIVVEAAGGIIDEIAITIADREFTAEIIKLDPVLTGIRTDPDPQKTRESEILWAIINRTGKNIYHFANFSPPVASTRRTSFFGDRRVYEYSNNTSDTSIHAGIDYGVPKGTAVNACGSGKVVLARTRIVTGKSVIIEHLPGIYSLYYHLDKIEVDEGVLVETGTLLGLSGATGLATGPHLHWEIRVFGENTDPDAFISRPILDKEAILSKIYP
jgi:murein DD-endopeptidase MepM/ murein hydrolase activator NlpD